MRVQAYKISGGRGVLKKALYPGPPSPKTFRILVSCFDRRSSASLTGIFKVLGGGVPGGTFFHEGVAPNSYFFDRALVLVLRGIITVTFFSAMEIASSLRSSQWQSTTMPGSRLSLRADCHVAHAKAISSLPGQTWTGPYLSHRPLTESQIIFENRYM